MLKMPVNPLRTTRLAKWLAFLLMLLALTLPHPAFSRPEAAESRTHLCGKLLFLVDADTGANLLGLRNCIGQETLIFSQHPAQLHNYYEFKNVTIKSGERVRTDKHGYLNKYITAWGSYEQIANCSMCGKGISITATQPSVPTQKPVTTAVPIYGKILNLNVNSSEGTSQQAPVLFPCGATTPYLLSGLGGNAIAEGYYAIYEPAIQPGAGQTTAYGPVEKAITGWVRITTIDSCQAVGLAESELQQAFTVNILNMSWSAPPEELKPVDLSLDVRVTGPPASDRGYLLKMAFSPGSLPENFELAFDSANCPDCTPGELGDGEFLITIHNVRIPGSYQGKVNLELSSVSQPEVSTQFSQDLTVAASSEPNRLCTAGLLRGVLSLAGEGAAAAGESDSSSGVAASQAIQEAEGRLDQCGDDQTCVQAALDQIFQDGSLAGLEKLAVMQPVEKTAVLLGRLGNSLADPSACTDWLRQYLYASLEGPIQQGLMANALLAQSPVYPLVVNAAGQRSGFLEGGQTALEIPGTHVLALGDQRLILWDGSEPLKMQASGYQPGVLNLTLLLSRGASYGERLYYPGVVVGEGSRLSLDLTQTDALLEEDLDGDGKVDRKIPPLERQAIGEAPPGSSTSAQPAFQIPPNILTILAIAAGVVVLLGVLVVVLAVILLRRRNRENT
jgi:hypothetical protein